MAFLNLNFISCITNPCNNNEKHFFAYTDGDLYMRLYA